MKSSIFILSTVLLWTSLSSAKSIGAFDQKTKGLEVWDVENDYTPVYYGAVLRGKDPYSKAIHACLALAFTKVEDGQVHYIHKMWAPSGGKCYYTSTSQKTKYIVDNQSACTPDGDRSSNGNGTRVMSPDNISPLPGGQRIVDFDAGYAGQWTRCPYFDSAGTGLTGKEQRRMGVYKGLPTYLHGKAAAGDVTASKILGAFEQIHQKTMDKAKERETAKLMNQVKKGQMSMAQMDVKVNDINKTNYWGMAGLHAIDQIDDGGYKYFHMTTNGLGHGLVYKVNMDMPRNTSTEVAPTDSELHGIHW